MSSKSFRNDSKSRKRRYVLYCDRPHPPHEIERSALKHQRKPKEFYTAPENGAIFFAVAEPKLEDLSDIHKFDAHPLDDFYGFDRTRTPSPAWSDIPSDSSRAPSQSSVSSSSCPSVLILEIPRRKPLTPEELQSRKRFKGDKQVSLRGKHDVLVYPIPGSEDAYVFCHQRTNVHYQIYQCIHCWEFKRHTPILVSLSFYSIQFGNVLL